jgi:hypothetical protein
LNSAVEDATEKLAAHYTAIEAELTLRDEPTFSDLVRPNGNSEQPFHRWFHVKEAYSYELLTTVLDRIGFSDARRLSIIDPFVGSGTTLVSADQWKRDHPHCEVTAVGFEANPFLHFLTATKVKGVLRASRLPPLTPIELGHVPISAELPGLSTFRNRSYFPPQVLQRAAGLLARANELPASLSRDLHRLALAGALESSSKLRRDGRTVRYWPSKRPANLESDYRSRLRAMSGDVVGRRPSGALLAVHLGDGRRFAEKLAPSEGADLIIFSPPYPNNIDYTEVYKIEAWFLGFYETEREFREQRRRTMRSHPSIKFSDTFGVDDQSMEKRLEAIVDPVLRALPDGRYRLERRRTVRGYVGDLALTLRHARTMLAPEGRIVIVVGNSLHGSGSDKVLVAADLLIAKLASEADLLVEELVVARRPARRAQDEAMLRESVLILSRA